MGALEALIVVLVVLFYIVRAIVQGIRALLGGARRALGSGGAVTTETARRQAMEQIGGPVSSQKPEARRVPLTSQSRSPERPGTGGPAVTGRAEFAARVARLEAAEGPGLPSPTASDGTTAAGDGLSFDGNDIIRAVILQEVLAKPLSQRRRVERYREIPPASPQS